MFCVARDDISQFPYYFLLKFEILQGKRILYQKIHFSAIKSQCHLLIIQKTNFI
jgi:hypothetical protein